MNFSHGGRNRFLAVMDSRRGIHSETPEVDPIMQIRGIKPYTMAMAMV